MVLSSWIRQLRSSFSGRASGYGKHVRVKVNRGKPHKKRYQPRVEVFEDRCVPTVSILNGGGSGYTGNGGGGPPDVTGAAGPNSYLEINNSTVTLFSPKANRTILAQDGINDFFYNSTIGNQTLIYSSTSTIAPSSGSPAGATEAGTTVTITTTSPHGFLVGEFVSISGVGVAGYNGSFKITAATTNTFQYTASAGLANSGGGTAHAQSCGTCDSTGVFDNLMGANGRFIIGEIDIDASQNVGQYIFAVSKSSTPTTFTTTDWNFYHITTTEGSGGPGSTSWTDYPGNPGFNADAFVETFNMFGNGPTGTQVISVNATDLANGVSQASLNFFSNDVPGGAQNYRPTTMQDSVAGDPMWLVHDDGDGANLNIVKMTSVLSSSASFDGSSSAPGTKLALPAQVQFVASGGIGNPLNPNNVSAIDGDDDSGQFDPQNPGGGGAFDPGSRILKASEANNTIVAAHTVAVAAGPNTLASAQANDKNGNPLGGSGYTVGDTLTVVGGTFTTAAKLTVATLGPNGRIATVTVANAGSYSSLSGITGGVTGGTGTGASFSLFFTGELAAQWYAVDVSSGTPAFQTVGGNPNVGREGFGANSYSFEPAIDINSKGEIGLGFMESDTLGGAVNPATGGFISTFVTARLATDAAGTMQPVVLVPAGTGTANINGRVGDFSGMNVDPANGTFWHVNEFGGAGGPTAIANFTPEGPPVVTPPSDQTGVEGASKAFNLGSFADADGSPWTVKVHWGDGTPDTVFTTTSSGSLGTRSHTYAEEGNKVVTVTVTDNTTLSDSKSFNINVSDPAVAPTGGFVFSAVEGAPSTTQTLGTFTDPGGPEVLGDYSADINWGDGTGAQVGAGSISFSSGVFTVTGSHTYAEESSGDHSGFADGYHITVTIHHDAAPAAIAHSTATVSDPAVLAAGIDVASKEGIAFTAPVATFTDPGGAEALGDYTATVDFGDGNGPAPATIAFTGTLGSKTDAFLVSGSHTFAEEGTFTVTVTIDHEGVITQTSSTSVVRDNFGLLLLDPTGDRSLMVTGKGNVTVNNTGAVVVDSSSPSAIFLTGQAVVTTWEADVGIGGGAVVNGQAVLNLLEPEFNHEAATADPIALSLPPMPTPHFPAVHYSGSAVLTLSPGTYDGGIAITGNGNVTLLPGVYYMNGGGFSVTGKGAVTDNAAGVLIVNAPKNSTDVINITGQGGVSLTAPMTLTGAYAAYDGITLMQDPASTNTVSVVGQGGLAMTGTLYAPKALLKIDGNGNVVVSSFFAGHLSLGGVVAVYDAMVTGNGNLVINADPAPASLPGSSAKSLAPTALPASQFLTWLTQNPATVSPLSINSEPAITPSKVAPAATQLLSAGSTIDRRGEPAIISGQDSSSQRGAIDRVFSDMTLGPIDDAVLNGIPGRV